MKNPNVARHRRDARRGDGQVSRGVGSGRSGKPTKSDLIVSHPRIERSQRLQSAKGPKAFVITATFEILPRRQAVQ
jgi:hypothetical protein